MVDEAMYRRYNGGAEKPLQPLNDPASARLGVSASSLFGLDDMDDFDLANAPPAYQAMKYALDGARRRAAAARSQSKRRSTKKSDHISL